MLDWIIGLTGLGGVAIGVGAWFLGIPALISVVAPFVKGGVEFLSWFISELWYGFKDMVDNASSLLFVATVVSIAGLYGYSLSNCYTQESTQIELPEKKSNIEKWDPFGIR